MKERLKRFKGSIIDAILWLTGKIWLKMTLAYFITFVVTMICFGLFFFIIFGELSGMQSLIGTSSSTNPFGNLPNTFSPVMIIASIIFGIAIIVVTAWSYNFYIKLSHHYIATEELPIGYALSKSFDKGLTRILSASFLLSLLYALIVGGGALLIFATHWIIGAITILFGLFYFLRFIIVLPAVVIGEMSTIQAIQYSLAKISFAKAFRLFIAGIVAGIILAIVFGLLSFIVGLLSAIPGVGVVINLAAQILMSGYITALTIAAMTGLYYRYSPIPEENNAGGVQDDDGLLDSGLV